MTLACRDAKLSSYAIQEIGISEYIAMLGMLWCAALSDLRTSMNVHVGAGGIFTDAEMPYCVQAKPTNCWPCMAAG